MPNNAKETPRTYDLSNAIPETISFLEIVLNPADENLLSLSSEDRHSIKNLAHVALFSAQLNESPEKQKERVLNCAFRLIKKHESDFLKILIQDFAFGFTAEDLSTHSPEQSL